MHLHLHKYATNCSNVGHCTSFCLYFNIFGLFSTEEVVSPTDLQFYEISDKKIVLTWSGPPGDVSGYRVTVVPLDESSSSQREMTLPISQNSYIEVSHLEPGTPYRFNIYTIHNGEESLPLIGEQTTSECKNQSYWNLETYSCDKHDNITIFLFKHCSCLIWSGFCISLSSEPDAPTDIHFANITENRAVMIWFAPRAKITGYRLFLTVEGSTPTQLRLPSRLTQYTLLNLKPDTEYSATLHAEQGSILSEGETAQFTTSECECCSKRLEEHWYNREFDWSNHCGMCVCSPTHGKCPSFQHWRDWHLYCNLVDSSSQHRIQGTSAPNPQHARRHVACLLHCPAINFLWKKKKTFICVLVPPESNRNPQIICPL